MSLKHAYRGGFEGRPGWWLVLTFDPNMIERLKTIPADMRAWDDVEKRWWVALEAEDEATRIIPALGMYRAQARLL